MAVFRSNLTFTDEQISIAPDLEPAFGNLSRTLRVDETLMTALRVNMINDRETFVGWMTRKLVSKISLQTSASIWSIAVWPTRARCRDSSRPGSKPALLLKQKHHVDAVAKAHGVLTTILPEGWTSMMVAFRTKFGKQIPDEKLPAHCYYEAFADKLAIGAPKAEPLSMVSAFEEEQQERSTPDPIRQYGLSRDAKLTIITEKRLVSTEPVDEKSLQNEYSIMTNMRSLAQMKQRGRSIYGDFDRSTFVDFLERLLDKKNFNLHKEVNGTSLLVPKWTDCMSYEFEPRKEPSGCVVKKVSVSRLHCGAPLITLNIE